MRPISVYSRGHKCPKELNGPVDTDDHRAVCVNKLLIQFAPSLTGEQTLLDEV